MRGLDELLARTHWAQLGRPAVVFCLCLRCARYMPQGHPLCTRWCETHQTTSEDGWSFCCIPEAPGRVIVLTPDPASSTSMEVVSMLSDMELFAWSAAGGL
jgi:hypothetical protein